MHLPVPVARGRARRLRTRVRVRHKKSCIGAIAYLPTDAHAPLINAQGSSHTEPQFKYLSAYSTSSRLADFSQPNTVSLSCVPVYTAQFLSWLCGRYALSAPESNANCKTFMPGKPHLSRSLITSGVRKPRSSAMTLRLPVLFTDLKNLYPGPGIQWPFLAVSSPKGTAQKASKPLKWSILIMLKSSFARLSLLRHHRNRFSFFPVIRV